MDNQLDPKRPKRILHIGKYFPPHRGGMETVLRDLMTMQVRDDGLEVAAVVHSSQRRLTDVVEIINPGYRIRYSARWLTLAFTPISPFFLLSLLKEIKRLDPDEIIIHMPNTSAFWLLLLPRSASRNWVVLWHSDVVTSNFNFVLKGASQIYKVFESAILRRASKIIATSPPYLEASDTLARYKEKCVVEAITLDAQRVPLKIRQAAQPKKQPGEGVRVLCVGRLTYYKGFDTVILAIRELPAARLRIVGHGELLSDLTALTAQLGLQNRVEFMGNLSDEELWRQYVWCDVHVLPSIEKSEAFGLAVTEAALFNKPNIVSDLSGSGLAWNAERTGSRFVKFPPGDVGKLSCALLTFCD